MKQTLGVTRVALDNCPLSLGNAISLYDRQRTHDVVYDIASTLSESTVCHAVYRNRLTLADGRGVTKRAIIEVNYNVSGRKYGRLTSIIAQLLNHRCCDKKHCRVWGYLVTHYARSRYPQKSHDVGHSVPLSEPCRVYTLANTMGAVSMIEHLFICILTVN